MSEIKVAGTGAGARRGTARAAKLRSEAANCVAVAVQVRETEFRAELIDEAVKLARRAHQIEGC